MAEAIYKSGQGYWTRMMSAAAFGLLVAQGTFWIWSKFGSGGTDTAKYAAGAVALLFLAGTGSLVFWLLGRKHSTVEFLIATEGEMKKVNWSTRREVIGSTWAVVVTAVVIAVFCWGLEIVFVAFFQWIKVLKS